MENNFARYYKSLIANYDQLSYELCLHAFLNSVYFFYEWTNG